MGLIKMGTNGNVDHRVDFQPTEKLMIGQKPESFQLVYVAKETGK
jgi:hypothetical protein